MINLTVVLDITIIYTPFCFSKKWIFKKMIIFVGRKSPAVKSVNVGYFFTCLSPAMIEGRL